MRFTGEKSIGDAVQSWLKNHGMEQKLNEVKISHLWEEVMGKTIATRTTNLRVTNAKLQITVSSAPLKSELVLNREKILNRINEELGSNYIKEVVIL
ncbi:MAG: DUF721 domain-containing protein [Bacteroidia bacterium]|nr:DUF721 domain-containing protein [Bacteroidia bacterium]